MFYSVLLVFIFELSEIKGQQPITTPVNGIQLYLAKPLKIIQDFEMVYSSQFSDNDDDDNITDALWCQSANNGSNIGLWYYPNGTQVPLHSGEFESGPSPIFSKRFTGQIALARNGELLGHEGLYTCIIPDENGVYQTLVVGIYRSITYNSNDGPDADSSMKFSLISTRDANPPVFTLTFNVSDGPPTNVNCTDGSNPFTIASGDLSRVVVNGPGSVTQVTVTMRMKQAGAYECTVSNARVTNGPSPGKNGPIATSSSSMSQPITVASTPTGLNATRLNTGLSHVQLSWSSVSGVAGYEVFYQLSSGSNSVMSAGITTNTMLDITSGLSYSDTYNFFVVSYGSESSTVLPSDHSNTTTLTLSSIPFVIFMVTSTNTTITAAWTSPLFAPQTYQGYCQCRRLCEQTYSPSKTSNLITSPYTFIGIDPGAYCIVGLIGIYGSDPASLGSVIVTTLSSAPTSSVSAITMSSVKARSMTISWNELPCSGQNGPITGYLLYYTNTTFSDIVNITRGDNRQFNLTTLTPYTSYTVTVIAYNDGGTGPTSNEVSQKTEEAEPGIISDLRINGVTIDLISVRWNISTVPNGVIIMYEICYRESNSNNPYNMSNTTNTKYSIGGLLPNTNYTIGVRAYTSVGPGEWSYIYTSTNNIPMASGFYVINVNDTTVHSIWQPIDDLRLKYYTIYYTSTDDIGSRIFPAGTTEGILGGLNDSIDYLFSLSVTFLIHDIEYEGERTVYISPIDIITTSYITSTIVSVFTEVSSSQMPLSVIVPTSVEISTAQSPTTTDHSSNIGLIIGVIVTLVIIVTVNFIFIISVIMILAHYRRRNRFFEIKNELPASHDLNDGTTASSIDNPMYGKIINGSRVHIYDIIRNDTPSVDVEKDYEVPVSLSSLPNTNNTQTNLECDSEIYLDMS